jgi:c-di-GMP-binding flagellar brake protein YcgR
MGSGNILSTNEIGSFIDDTIIQFINNDKTFFAGVVKNHQGNYLSVTININQDNYHLLNQSDEIQFVYIIGDSVIRYSTKVIGGRLSDQFQFVLLSIPVFINKIERRKHPRVPANFEVEFYFFNEDERLLLINQVPDSYYRRLRNTTSLDISGGGLSLLTDEKNERVNQAIIKMKFIEREIIALCSVIRFEKLEDGKGKKAALEFVHITNEDKKEILNYVNEKLKLQQ